MRLRPAAIGTVLLLAALTGCGANHPGAAPPAPQAVAPTQTVVIATPEPAATASTPARVRRAALVAAPEITAPTATPVPVEAVPTPKATRAPRPVATPKPTPVPPHNHPAPSGPDGQTCPAGYHYQSGQQGITPFCATGAGAVQGGAGGDCIEEGATGTDAFQYEEVCRDSHWRRVVTPTPTP